MNMRKLVLLFVLAYPLVSMAQRNDIYFIPKKAETIVILEDEDPCYEDEYVEENSADDSYVYDEDDFRYSTRIVRFRNTNSCLGSPLYWDLMYHNTYNDWLLYDNGYYIDIYPTYNNWWGWNSWYHTSWYDPWRYHHHYPSYHWNGHHHIHGGFRPPYINNNSWRPAHKVHTNVPVRKEVRNTNTASNGVRRNNNTARPARGEAPVVNRQSGQTSNRVRPATPGHRVNAPARNNNGETTTVRRQQPQRVTNGGKVNQSGGVRTQQPRRTSVPATDSKNDKVNSTQTRNSANSVRSSRTSSSSSSSRSSYRSSSSSSGEYNRPSSTSVSRQRSSSSGGSSMSGVARGGSVSRGGSRR